MKINEKIKKQLSSKKITQQLENWEKNLSENEKKRYKRFQKMWDCDNEKIERIEKLENSIKKQLNNINIF